MNSNSKDPMVRMFARREKESEEALAKLDRAAQVSKEVEKILREWKP